MTEPQILLMLTLSPLLWMAGGTWHKAWRRFVLPLAWLMLLVSLIPRWQAILACLGLVIVNALPYGDRTPWKARLLVFAALTTPLLIISWQGWWISLLFATVLSGAFWLSRRVHAFTHKFFEGLAGLLQAIAMIFGILSR